MNRRIMHPSIIHILAAILLLTPFSLSNAAAQSEASQQEAEAVPQEPFAVAARLSS